MAIRTQPSNALDEPSSPTILIGPESREQPVEEEHVAGKAGSLPMRAFNQLVSNSRLTDDVMNLLQTAITSDTQFVPKIVTQSLIVDPLFFQVGAAIPLLGQCIQTRDPAYILGFFHHRSEEHWTFVSCNMRSRCIEWYDSAPSSSRTKIVSASFCEWTSQAFPGKPFTFKATVSFFSLYGPSTNC